MEILVKGGREMVAGRDWGREGNMGNRKKEKEKELKGGLGYGERIGVGME